MTYWPIGAYSRAMGAEQPLTAALAEAASRFVGASKVGSRKGSRAAVARAMTEAGVEISSNTLNRKLAGEYPLNSDEISALAEVLGVDPDEIWADAIRIMREQRPARAPMTSAETAEHALSQVSSEAQEAIRAFKRADAVGSEGADNGTGSLAN